MRTHAPARTAAAVAAVALTMLSLAGCGSLATEPTASPTVTVAPPPASSSAPTASATPSASASASATAEPGPSTTTAGDPDRPAGQCADGDLGVSVAVADGGGSAGSREYEVLLTNTGGTRCVLRGTPGVSVVGGGNGTRIGAAAARDQKGVRTVALAAGQTAAAPLSIVDIAGGGGPLGSACTPTRGDGYRVYPPHSTRAFFVEDADALACASGRSFMTVGPVAAFAG